MTVLLLAAFVTAANPTPAAWPQWGGPARNFIAPDAPLAEAWPSGGPRTLWRRALGDGFSAIVSDGTTLYTLYRDGQNDVVVALDASDGRTVWETKYEAAFNETCSERLGQARSTQQSNDSQQPVFFGLVIDFFQQPGAESALQAGVDLAGLAPQHVQHDRVGIVLVPVRLQQAELSDAHDLAQG